MQQVNLFNRLLLICLSTGLMPVVGCASESLASKEDGTESQSSKLYGSPHNYSWFDSDESRNPVWDTDSANTSNIFMNACPRGMAVMGFDGWGNYQCAAKWAQTTGGEFAIMSTEDRCFIDTEHTPTEDKKTVDVFDPPGNIKACLPSMYLRGLEPQAGVLLCCQGSTPINLVNSHIGVATPNGIVKEVSTAGTTFGSIDNVSYLLRGTDTVTTGFNCTAARLANGECTQQSRWIAATDWDIGQ